MNKEEGESVRKEERKSLRDGEVLSLLDSDGKLLLVGGLAHVESMDVKGKGWGERKRKKKRKKNTNHDLFCLRVGGREQSTITVTLLASHSPRFLWDVGGRSGNKILLSAVIVRAILTSHDVSLEIRDWLIDLTHPDRRITFELQRTNSGRK